MPAIGSPGDFVAVTLDCDAHTLSVSVNGSDAVVIASSLPAATYYPVVSFYNEYEKTIGWLGTAGTSTVCTLGWPKGGGVETWVGVID